MELFGGHNQGLMVSSRDTLIYRNRIWGNGSDRNQDHGIYVESGDVTIRSNVVYDNYAFGIHLYSGAVLGGEGDVLVEHNYVYANGFGTAESAPEADVAGIVVAWPMSRSTVRYNVSCGNARSGVLVIDTVDDVTIEQNLTCHNGEAGLEIRPAGSRGRVEGNVSTEDRALSYLLSGDVASDHNVFWVEGGAPAFSWGGAIYDLAGFQHASGQDAASVVADPALAAPPEGAFDPSRASEYDFCTDSIPALCAPRP